MTVFPTRRLLQSDTHEGQAYVLLAFDQALDKKQKRALQGQGIQILEYIPQFCYLVRLDLRSNLALHRSALPNHKVYRLHDEAKLGLRSYYGEACDLIDGQTRLILQAYPGVSLTSMVHELQGLAQRCADFRRRPDRFVADGFN